MIVTLSNNEAVSNVASHIQRDLLCSRGDERPVGSVDDGVEVGLQAGAGGGIG